MASLMSRAVAFIVALPRSTAARAFGGKLGRPMIHEEVRIRHQLLPRGPRRAWLQEEQGVPNQIPWMALPRIQPSMCLTTMGSRRSCRESFAMSRGRAPYPLRIKDAVSRPDPANSSKKI
eukprot:6864951-Alexandrium_andersonii.AAC.1